MTNLLDLCITLTLPPDGAPPGTLAGFELRCEALGRQRATGRLAGVLTDEERGELRWYLEEYWQWPYEQFAMRGTAVERQLELVGRRLYDALFGSADAQRILQPWNLQRDVARQISVEGDIPAALSLPWELLHDGRGFLTLRARTPVAIVRRLPERDLAALPIPFDPPLRVLLVTARPEGAGFIDPRNIAAELLDELQPQIEAGAVAVELLRPPTIERLRRRLSDTKLPAIHLLHFDGHGTFQADRVPSDGLRMDGGGGQLAFEDDDGGLRLVAADDLAQVLQDSGVKLAVLNACQSAQGDGDDPFSSVAARLIGGGVDAVVAMSASILVVGAAKYVEAFYRALAGGQPAPIAHERARQALHDDPKRHPHQRTLDKEGTPVELRDWWLPHFYQQRPLTLQATQGAGTRKKSGRKKKDQGQTAHLGDLPQPPRYGFGGRARELLWIERRLLRGRLVALQGFGGVGKTALATEAANWLTRTGMYAGALFVSFEHGGDAALLLAELGRHLGVYNSDYRPDDPGAALAKLRPALRKQPTLLIADNLESILPGGDALLPADERTKLWDLLLDLSAPPRGSQSSTHGIGSGSRLSVLGSTCGVILTTRDTNFGDGRLAQGQWARHLNLGGLTEDDAYALAMRLLDSLEIPRARAPYLDLTGLLKRLDHHPLAIQLVLPALHDHPLDRIRADFIRLLNTFTDDTATGRNRSLLASLEYSLRRLGDAQRALLPRLAPFEGGAMEPEILAITEIPEAEWATLRVALEQAALLRAERVHEAIPAPFLHFHPILAPYLRTQPGADDEVLRQRYTARYRALARYLYDEDTRNPQPVRALVRRELPNLRRALDLLLERGEPDSTSQMANWIIRFLNNFGLGRERDELRRRVDVAVQAAGAASGALTQAEYLRESGRGEDEFGRGDLPAAYARFSALLGRIEALPEGAPLGRGSYEHCTTLHGLARCLSFGGQPAAAENRLRAALAVIEALIAQQPDDQSNIRQRGALLTDLGDVLRDLGRYPQAQVAYEESLKSLEAAGGDERGKGVVLGQLGTLALQQRDYPEAHRRYTEALDLFRALGEPASEAVAWHQLGMVAQWQQQWAEAERCYRESLAIKERLGDSAGAASTYGQLATMTQEAGRPAESEGWHRRLIKLCQRIGQEILLAKALYGLANLLRLEIRAGRTLPSRLIETKSYAEQALAIIDSLDVPEDRWKVLAILADIADLEDRPEAAREYRHRERAAFAAFEGNRWHIDQQAGQLIAAIVAATRGNAEARTAVDQALPQLEANGWRIAEATRRIWAGEREWEALVEEIDANSALLVLRVLEELNHKDEG